MRISSVFFVALCFFANTAMAETHVPAFQLTLPWTFSEKTLPSYWAFNWRTEWSVVKPRSTPPSPEELLETARAALGTPYSWGAIGRGGFDCSGFVNMVYAENGYDLPRTSREQYRVGEPVSRSHEQPGDLLFFVSTPGGNTITHVAIYIGDDEFIHAASGKGEVTYDRLTSSYYANRHFGSRRFLSLPPGSYANDDGSAKASTDQTSIPQTSTDAIDTILLAENTEEERPLQLAPTLIQGSITHAGPRLLRREKTFIGFRLGVGGLDGEPAVLFSPEWNYFDHEHALFVALAFPVHGMGQHGRSFSGQFKQDHDSPSDFSRILQQISFGQKESNLYLELGRTVSGTLGYGQLMRNYTPSLGERALPDFVVTTTALSLAADINIGAFGGETFIDDILHPLVLGGRFKARPLSFVSGVPDFWQQLQMAVTYVIDTKAPLEYQSDGSLTHEAVHAAGLTLELTPILTERLRLSTYVDGSALFFQDASGNAFSLGALAVANLGTGGAHVLRFHLSAQLAGDHFLPQYFGGAYRQSRQHILSDQVSQTPMTKQAQALAQHGTQAFLLGEFVYQWQRRVALGLRYQDGGPEEKRAMGRFFHAFMALNRIYLPSSSRSFDVYVAYHLENFSAFAPFLGGQRNNEFVFVQGAVELTRFLSATASLKKGYDAALGQTAVDGMLGLLLDYEL